MQNKHYKEDFIDKPEIKTELGNIKDDLFLLSLIILSAGIVYSDAYYQAFGFRNQIQSLSVMYFIYKGLLMVIGAPYMLIPYGGTLCLLLFEIWAVINKKKFILSIRKLILYVFLVVCLVTIYPFSNEAGFDQASNDMTEEKSLLPKIELLCSNDMTIAAEDKFRLFLSDDDFITIFKTVDSIGSNLPVIIRINKSEISLLKTIKTIKIGD